MSVGKSNKGALEETDYFRLYMHKNASRPIWMDYYETLNKGASDKVTQH